MIFACDSFKVITDILHSNIFRLDLVTHTTTKLLAIILLKTLKYIISETEIHQLFYTACAS